MSEPLHAFAELSRKAACGELTADERAALDAYLRDHPERRADLAWDRALQRRLDEKIDAMPAMPGWERTQQIMAAAAASAGPAVTAATAVTAVTPTRQPALLDRLSDWLQATFGWVVNLQALAAALVIAQAAVIGVLAWEHRANDVTEIRAGAPTDAQRGPVLRVSFRDDIREGELRKALADIGGEIVGGPGQLGVYLVRVRDLDLAPAADRLRATGLTALVEIYEPKR